MITLEKIGVYQRYAGDLDAWARRAAAVEKTVITDDEWRWMDALVQDLELVQAGLASRRYAERLAARLAESVNDPEALALLNALARVSCYGIDPSGAA